MNEFNRNYSSSPSLEQQAASLYERQREFSDIVAGNHRLLARVIYEFRKTGMSWTSDMHEHLEAGNLTIAPCTHAPDDVVYGGIEPFYITPALLKLRSQNSACRLESPEIRVGYRLVTFDHSVIKDYDGSVFEENDILLTLSALDSVGQSFIDGELPDLDLSTLGRIKN